MRTAFIIYIVIILTFSSCEGFIHLQGHVIDNETKKPIENAQIILVIKDRDTLKNNHFEYDTISYNTRIALRKSGLKDDYKFYSAGGLSKKPIPSLTDTKGSFAIGDILVSCVPKCPTCKIIFIKEGYKQLTLKLSSIVSDSLQVSLEKSSDNISN